MDKPSAKCHVVTRQRVSASGSAPHLVGLLLAKSFPGKAIITLGHCQLCSPLPRFLHVHAKQARHMIESWQMSQTGSHSGAAAVLPLCPEQSRTLPRSASGMPAPDRTQTCLRMQAHHLQWEATGCRWPKPTTYLCRSLAHLDEIALHFVDCLVQNLLGVLCTADWIGIHKEGVSA